MDRQPLGHNPFPTTQWSLVYRAGTPGSQPQGDPLSVLLHRYLPVLKSYLVTSRRLPPEEADDALQDFVLDKVIRQRLLAHADERKGRFRTFLLTVLNRYLIDRYRQQRRSPAWGAAPLEQLSTAAAPPGGDLFDAEWARSVLSRALAATEAECREAGRLDLWRIFEARVVRPAYEGVEPTEYAALAEQLGLQTPVQMSNRLVTSKRMFARNLRAEVESYCHGEAEVERELIDLKDILARGAQDHPGGAVDA